MPIFMFLACASGLLIFAYFVLRVVVRRDYRQLGRLSWGAAALETAVFALHANLSYGFLSARWPALPRLPPINSLRTVVGLALVGLGLIATLTAMVTLGVRRLFGLQGTGLEQSGFYRFSRNPQIVAYGLMLSGFALLWPSLPALIWLLLYAPIAHLMVRTEEEHLQRLYRPAYTYYCQRVPRYLPPLR
jgi:protein-S-isoprenylcysteine O-methyltransferase Ste14